MKASANIQTAFHDGFKWATYANVSFKGYLFDQNKQFLQAEEAVHLFERIKDAGSLKNIIKDVDGIFSVIIKNTNSILAASDSINAFPLYYSWINDGWVISDNAYNVLQASPGAINASALPEFLSAGFVLGRETLINGIHRIQAGEIMTFGAHGDIARECYHWFLGGSFRSEPEEALKNELQQLLADTAQRLVQSLGGRTAIVPLSGGYDSRLIACMLKKAAYANTICLTYGRPNPESEISRDVARKLGFKWIFVDYREIEAKSFPDDATFQAYSRYAGNLSAMPYLQEYFAVKHLKEVDRIPGDSVFLPGHTGDYIAGSYVEKTIRTNRRHTKDNSRLIDSYFTFMPLNNKQKKMISDRLSQWFFEYDHPPAATAKKYDVFVEDWDLKEKISKFIFNSSRVFSFFGYQYRFPLWDAELRIFFRELPFALRSYKNLYDKVIEEAYFKPLGVFFGSREIRETALQLRMKKLRMLFRRLIPYCWRKKRMEKRDYVCYNKFTAALARELSAKEYKADERINSYNAIICRWYAQEASRATKDRKKR